MLATTQIKYLDKELIASQSFHTLGPGTTTLTVSYGEESIAIEFVVSETEGVEVNKMWAQVVSIDRLHVHLVNFRQLMPSQVLGPVDLGTLAARPLTLVVEVTGVKNTPCKYVSYSLYLGGMNA